MAKIGPETPAPELARPQETVAEAQEAMLRDGAGFVENYLSPDQCAMAVEGLSEEGFFAYGEADFKPVQGREQYLDDLPGAAPVPEVLWQVEDDIKASFDAFSQTHPEFSDWSERATALRGARQLIKQIRELVRYPAGVDVKKHLDQMDNGEYPSQALLTLTGEGVLEIFDKLDDEEPRLRIPLTPGTLVFLRGNEVPPLVQLPHAVKHTKGPRVLFTVGAYGREQKDRLQAITDGNRASQARREARNKPKKGFRNLFKTILRQS